MIWKRRSQSDKIGPFTEPPVYGIVYKLEGQVRVYSGMRRKFPLLTGLANSER
jgi:hypothetical protein